MNKIKRLRTFADVNKRAILCQNKAALGSSEDLPQVSSERPLVHSNVVVCRRCGGFYSRKTIYRHQKCCLSKDETTCGSA